MRRRDRKRAGAHAIRRVAEDLGLARVDVLEGLLALWITERHHRTDLGRRVRVDLSKRVVRHGTTLRVSAEHELRVGAILNGLVGQGVHGLDAVVVAAGGVALDRGGVVDTLGGDVAVGVGEGAGEAWADDGAEIAGFAGAAGEDEGQGCAFAVFDVGGCAGTAADAAETTTCGAAGRATC